MRIQRLTAVVTAAALLLTGCTSLSLSSTDMLTPPRASGSRAEVQRMIEKDADGSYELIYPTSGEHKSGIILHDFDADGDDDAVALYTTSDGTPRILVASNRDDSFSLIGVAQLRSANVTGLSFADIDADGSEEILISCDIPSSLAAIEAYLIGDGISSVKIGEGFTDCVAGDFDGNSAVDVLLMTPAADQQTAQARLMVYDDGAFSEKSACEIDSSVTSYVNLRHANISDDIAGAVADGKLDNGAFTTQLLYYDSAAHMLVNPLFMNTSYSESKRDAAVFCKDIDGDEIIEVPVCSLMDHTKDEDIAAVCTLVRWSGYEPELMALSPRQNAVLCDKLGFMLAFSTEQLSTMTARYTDDNAVTLYRVTYKNSEPVIGNELLTVKRYDKANFDSSLTAEALLTESGAYTYTYILSEGTPFTNEDIENSFSLLNADES